MTQRPKVTIYTDGACSGNPGPGGWAALLRYQIKEKVITGNAANTTSNRMELTAAVKALEALNKPCQVAFFTDSVYLKRGVTEWLPGWKARNWKRKKGQLKNVDLWKALDTALQNHEINWHWVRGHAGDRFNERVDRLARRAIKKA